MRTELENKELSLTKQDLLNFIEEEFSSEEANREDVLEALHGAAGLTEDLDELTDFNMQYEYFSIDIPSDDIVPALEKLEAVQIGILEAYEGIENEVYFLEDFNAIVFVSIEYGTIWGVQTQSELNDFWSTSDLPE
jgi:hypothetical protein